MTTHNLFLLDCPSYEDYLNTFVTLSDFRYMRNLRYCRMLVELGYRSAAGIYSPEEYEKHKAAVKESLFPTKSALYFFSDGLTIKDRVLYELASREKANRQEIISTIIFLYYRSKAGFIYSGYIDYEHSLRRGNLKNEDVVDWRAIFQEKKLLRPKKNDLSYYDWHKGHTYYNNSDNYAVLHDVEGGLIFMHRGDHKKINVDASQDVPDNNCKRSMFLSETYGQVVFYDHVVRKKI